MNRLVCGLALVGALLLAAVPPAQAQRWGGSSPGSCPGGVCPQPQTASWQGYLAPSAPQAQTFAPQTTGYVWIPANGGFGLFLGSRQIGSWVDRESAYYPYDGARFGEPCEPPCSSPGGGTARTRKVVQNDPPKCGCLGKCECECECTCVGNTLVSAGPPEPALPNYGIIRDRPLQPGRTWLNGREVPLRTAIEAVGTPGIPDDGLLPCLVIRGSEYECSAVRKDLDTNPALAYWKGRVKVQCYNPAVDGQSWVAKDFPEGKPAIRFQDAKGKGYFLLTSYPGPDQLAEALRKTDPLYDPKKDPNPLAPKPGPSPEPAPATPLNPWAVIVGCVAVAVIGYLILRRPQQ